MTDPMCKAVHYSTRLNPECKCNEYFKVRQDEREKARSRQARPSWKYPFTMAVTVRQP